MFESEEETANSCLDWRTCKRNEPVHSDPRGRQMLNGYNKGTKARVVTDTDGNKMKYCPGNRCKVFLPLFQFAYNYNMSDGMDTYCVECNQVKRREKEERRRKSQGNTYSVDKFEEFRLRQYRPHGSPDIPVLKRDVTRKIDEALDSFKEKKPNVELPFTSQVLYDKLFNGRRLVCTETGKCLTPSCFMDHHALSVVVENGKRLDVKCNKVNIP